MDNLILVTSNEFKLKEFKRFGLENLNIEKGQDLKEVDSDPYTVILYKSKEAGVNRIVEDTSLIVEGAVVDANIRWILDNLSEYNGRTAIWKVLLGLNNGKNIEIYEGVIKGKIVKKFDELKGFGFDSLFVPNGSDLTLYELENLGEKDEFSARKNAIQNLITKKVFSSKEINSIPKWEGKYQNEHCY